jgi:hypothetical protein
MSTRPNRYPERRDMQRLEGQAWASPPSPSPALATAAGTSLARRYAGATSAHGQPGLGDLPNSMELNAIDHSH